jgi:hypothetical protein
MTIRENSMANSQKIKTNLPFNPEILLLGIYTKELEEGS